MIWTRMHPRATFEMLGYLPDFFDERDLRPAREQIDTAYRNGGGWRPTHVAFTMTDNALLYPGDPPMALLFEAKLRDETIRFYNASWLAIIQKDGSYEIARVD